jgi:hypothetical protein
MIDYTNTSKKIEKLTNLNNKNLVELDKLDTRSKKIININYQKTQQKYIILDKYDLFDEIEIFLTVNLYDFPKNLLSWLNVVSFWESTTGYIPQITLDAFPAVVDKAIQVEQNDEGEEFYKLNFRVIGYFQPENDMFPVYVTLYLIYQNPYNYNES